MDESYRTDVSEANDLDSKCDRPWYCPTDRRFLDYARNDKNHWPLPADFRLL